MKCDLCAKFKAQRSQNDLSLQAKRDLRDQKRAHLGKVILERQAWHKRISLCKSTVEGKDPDCFAIYLDGMDQEKTDIPRMKTTDVRAFGKPLKVRSLLFLRVIF
jgi:hypothetical protein